MGIGNEVDVWDGDGMFHVKRILGWGGGFNILTERKIGVDNIKNI
jgi:hypothetical protein